MRRANAVVTRDQLIQAGWGYDADVRDNARVLHPQYPNQALSTRVCPSHSHYARAGLFHVDDWRVVISIRP
jgi:hypothetical protein